MTHPWDELWPAPEAPSDFALRVLVASAEERGRRRRRSVWLGVAGAALAACVVLGIGGTISLSKHQSEAVKRAAVLEAQSKETEERLRRLQAEFELATRKEHELLASLEDAKDEVMRSKLQAELEVQKKSTAAVRSAVRAGRGSSSGSIAKPLLAQKKCPPADPLCN